MKKPFSLSPSLSTLIAFALVAMTSVVVTGAAIADEPEIERQVKLKIVADGDTLDAELGDLEIGESQQLFTQEGNQVVATRTEEGYELDIEGRDEPILVRTGDHAYAFSFDTDCEGDDCPRHIAVTKDIEIDGEGHGAGRRMVFIGDNDDIHVVGDDDGDMTWIEHEGAGEGGVHVIRSGDGAAAAERLIESGALDDLDDAKRQEILDALRAGDGASGVDVKVIKMRRGGDHEEHEDE